MSRKNLDGKTIDSSNVEEYISQIFSAKERKEMISLSRWYQKLNKSEDQYSNVDIDKIQKIFDYQYRAKMIDSAEYKALFDSYQDLRPVKKDISLEGFISIKTIK